MPPPVVTLHQPQTKTFTCCWRWTLLWLLACLWSSGCQQPPIYHWRLQSYAAADSFELNQLKALAAHIKQMSGGRLVIVPLASGEVTSGPDIYTAVKEQRVEMGNGWPNWWSGHHPAWALMNGGPFEFMNLDASMLFFTAGPGIALGNELARGDGILWSPAWWAGMEFGLLTREPVHSLADLHGKTVRIGPGLPSEVVAIAAEVTVLPLVPNELEPALLTGVVDAVEWTTPAGTWELGLHKLAPYAIVPAIWQPSVLSDFLINEQAFRGLPADLQAILQQGLQAYSLTMTSKAKLADFAALAKFKAHGTEFSHWSDEDIARWRQASEQVYSWYREQDQMSAKIIQAKADFKREYQTYYQIFGSYE